MVLFLYSFANKQNWVIPPARAIVLLLPRRLPRLNHCWFDTKKTPGEAALWVGLALSRKMKLLPSGHSLKGWGDWANKNSSALRVCRYTTFFAQVTLSYIVDFSELQPSLLICFQWLMCIFKKRKEKNANPLDFLLPCHLWWQCAEKIELTNNFLLVKKNANNWQFPSHFSSSNFR